MNFLVVSQALETSSLRAFKMCKVQIDNWKNLRYVVGLSKNGSTWDHWSQRHIKCVSHFDFEWLLVHEKSSINAIVSQLREKCSVVETQFGLVIGSFHNLEHYMDLPQHNTDQESIVRRGFSNWRGAIVAQGRFVMQQLWRCLLGCTLYLHDR